MQTGIYKIENLLNGKMYIGSSSELPIRKYNHFNQLKKNKHPNNHLQLAYNKSICSEPLRGRIVSKEVRNKISDTLKSKNIIPPSRTGIGYGFCKLYCSKKHYKTSKTLIHGSNACKECQRIKSQNWRKSH